MFKVTYSSDNHFHFIFVTIINGVLIFNAASRLNNGIYSSLVGDSNTVGKGKNASLAITAPCKSNLNFLALSMACCKASTRDVCPVPEASNCLFFASTMVFDLVCLQILEANNRSSISVVLGANCVTVLRFSA